MNRYRGGSPTTSQSSDLNGGISHPCLSQDLPTEWTDEKHSLYLNSMEASFVNQLHNSMDLLQLQKETSNPKSFRAHYTAPAQFKVLRRGCWQRVILRRPDSELRRNDESRDFMRSPWIQHFRSPRKSQDMEPLPLRESRAFSSGGKDAVSSGSGCGSKHSSHMYSHRQILLDCKRDNIVEMSDQNFVDENVATEEANCTGSSKRMKTNASNGDQVVPTGKLAQAGEIPGKNNSQKEASDTVT